MTWTDTLIACAHAARACEDSAQTLMAHDFGDESDVEAERALMEARSMIDRAILALGDHADAVALGLARVASR